MPHRYFIWIFIMNKRILLSAVFMLSFFAANVLADRAKIVITANVVAKTCSISSATKSFLVNLASGNLRGVGVGIPFTYSPFSINLEDCPSDINTAHVTFSGESDPEMPNLLKVSSGADFEASGIAIGLYNLEKKNIDIRNNFTDYPITHSSAEHGLTFLVAYLKTRDTALAGKVVGIASFEITYD